jgi:deoxyribose-phosphate aldolase
MIMVIPVASYIDHTLLKATCRSSDINQLCREAVEFKFAAVCVPPFMVKEAADALKDSEVKAATVIGFPMGYSSIASKLSEIDSAIRDGADELDTVINLIALKNGDWSYLEKEMQLQVELIHKKRKIVKVIVESGILSEEELIHCCNLYGRLGIDYMKTSTGFAEKGASVSDVQIMRKELPPDVKIKASGGIRHFSFAMELVDAGAERLGCSTGVQIVKEEKLQFNNAQ